MAILKNLALALASFVSCLGVLEIGLRIVNGLPAIPDRNFILERAHVADINNLTGVEYDPVLGWIQQSNVRFNSDNPNISFTTGEYGVRMNLPEIRALPKSAILVVGDSFTAGSEVGDTQSWPAQLELEIRQPVINAAAGGWGGMPQILLK
jgi:hypothetical protein